MHAWRSRRRWRFDIEKYVSKKLYILFWRADGTIVYRGGESTSFQDRPLPPLQTAIANTRKNREPSPPPAMARDKGTINNSRASYYRSSRRTLLPPQGKHDRAEIESRANSKSDSSIRILSTRFLDPCINRFEREREREREREELKMLGEGKLAVKIRARENGRTETEKKERGLLFLGANF